MLVPIETVVMATLFITKSLMLNKYTFVHRQKFNYGKKSSFKIFLEKIILIVGAEITTFDAKINKVLIN